MEEWKKLIEVGVELLVTALVIISGVNLNSVKSQMATNIQTENNAVMVAKEYRLYNMYDETTIYAQDVVSAILQFRGAPICSVHTLNGTTYTYYPTYSVGSNPMSSPDDYTTDSLQARFIAADNNNAASVQYKCNLVKDLNGDISEINFVAVT